MKKVTIVLFTAFFFASGYGQGLKLGPQLGMQKAVDAENGTVMVGGAVRMKLTPSLGAEGSINYRREKYADGNVTVKSWPVMLTGLFYPIPIAYGAAGFGWYNTTFDYDLDVPFADDKDETEQEVGWHFGGGVELPIGPRTILTGDIRYVFLNYDFEEIPGSDDIESDFYVITVGLLFGL